MKTNIIKLINERELEMSKELGYKPTVYKRKDIEDVKVSMDTESTGEYCDVWIIRIETKI